MVSLSKGQKISLGKNMNLCLVGLGWDPNKYRGQYDFDLDAVAFLLGANGKVQSDSDFIFYGNSVHPSGAVKTLGDDTSGGNSDTGDDEKIIMNYLKQNQGTIPYTAKTSAETVEEVFHMSRKAFKRALGDLYKKRKIYFDEENTYITKK